MFYGNVSREKICSGNIIPKTRLHFDFCIGVIISQIALLCTKNDITISKAACEFQKYFIILRQKKLKTPIKP